MKAFKGYSVILDVLMENKMIYSLCRFVKMTIKITIEHSKIWSASNSLVNAPYLSS